MKMDGIELRVEENRARTIDRRLDEERNRKENREPRNQDQDGSSEKPSDREQNAQPKTTRNGRSQDVEERRESNRTSMTNLAEKRSRECNRDQITIGTNRNQIESNGGHANEKGRTTQARERIPSKQKNEKQASPRVPFTSKGAKFESKRRAKNSRTRKERISSTISTWTASFGPSESYLLRKNKKELGTKLTQKRIQWKQKEACCTARVC